MVFKGVFLKFLISYIGINKWNACERGVHLYKKKKKVWLDWRQILKSFYFMCWKGHARLNSSAAVKQPVSWLNVANPVKWQHGPSLLLSLMFFFNLAQSFHLPPTFTQLLRGLTCCWKRWNDIFEQIWGERARGGWCIAAIDYNRTFYDDDKPFTAAVQQGQAKEWRKERW